MLFGQRIHPYNFEYGSAITIDGDGFLLSGNSFKTRVTCAEITASCSRLRFDNSNVADKKNYSDAIIETHRAGTALAPNQEIGGFVSSACDIRLEAGRLSIHLKSGAVLKTAPDGIGFLGEAAIINFDTTDATGFYGFGERTKRFNKSGDTLDFYNVDVGAVFPHTFGRDDYDPAYVAIPLAIIRAHGISTGIFFDNPERLLFDVGQIETGHLICESLGGNNDIYIVSGPTLKDVTRNFAEITGRADVPPLWSLGHHQCRWGYKTASEFYALKKNFLEYDVPVSALWYDIDYMDEYRVFTWDKRDIPDPASVNKQLKEAGIRAVAIVDPGVKLDEGYSVYQSGKGKDIFCKTLSGKDYVGKVWPGDTVFPDFSLEPVRKWWAEHLARFMADASLDGAWLDMNDPATGWSMVESMRFGGGAVPHAKYHNQYGHFMARASKTAFEINDKTARPFLLTRSGFAGTQRYSAIWTGDNVSNWDHLRMAIPCTINLGLSGVAFNGPDVGGFFGHTEEELITRWYQAGFLFPFFRNHSTNHTKEQEPWNFGPLCLARVRNAIYTRYRLLPYLYNCFFNHHVNGDPVLRPLLYEFEDSAFEFVDDQFMVGSEIMLAPICERASTSNTVVTRGVSRQERHVMLPPGWWFDILRGQWVQGGRTVRAEASLDETLIYIRDGAVIPYFNGKVRNADTTLDDVELHIFSKERTGECEYYIDDRESLDFAKGLYNVASVSATMSAAGATVRITESGNFRKGSVEFSPVFYGSEPKEATMEHDGKVASKTLRSSTRRWIASDVSVLA